VSLRKRFVSYLLLFVLGFFALKNLLPGAATGDHDCQEFGHLHFFHFEKIAAEGSLQHIEGNCHEGKYLLSHSPFPAVVFDLFVPTYKVIHELVFTLENQFKSPYLEPRRKPPKFS